MSDANPFLGLLENYSRARPGKLEKKPEGRYRRVKDCFISRFEYIYSRACKNVTMQFNSFPWHLDAYFEGRV